MSNFLENLIARSKGLADVIQPRVPALFEPYPARSALLANPIGEYRERESLEQFAPREAESKPSHRRAMERAASQHGSHDTAPALSAIPKGPAFEAQDFEFRRLPSLEARSREFSAMAVRRDEIPSSKPKPPSTVELPEPERAPAPSAPKLEARGSAVQNAACGDDENRKGASGPADAIRPHGIEISAAQAEREFPRGSAVAQSQPSPALGNHAGPKQPQLVEPPSIRPSARSEKRETTPPASQSEPIIRVTIGQIEVRAVPQQRAAPKPAPPRRPLSLDKYLGRRARRGGQ